jgi:hypothetical protein
MNRLNRHGKHVYVYALLLSAVLILLMAPDSHAQVCVQPPSSAGTSSIDANGNVIADGAKFFPIGFYGPTWRQPFAERMAALNTIAQAGFNTMFAEDISTNQFGELLDEAARLNMKILVGSSSLTDNQYIGATVDNYKSKPAVLAWSLFDDADDGKVSAEQLKARSDFVKRQDANRFTYSTLTGYYTSRRNAKSEWLQAADASSLQMYPIATLPDYSFDYGGNPLTESYRVSLDYALAAEKIGKAFIVNAQTFSWGTPTSRYPTPKEFRNMFYGHIMAGAKGIISFDYSNYLFDTQKPLWNEYVALKDDVLGTLKAPILNGVLTRKSTADTELNYSYWEYANELYLAVLNTSQNTTKPVSITLPPAYAGTLTPLIARLPATLQLANGVLSGNIGAADVQVVKISRSQTPSASRTITYAASNQDFANPERGFAYENDVPWPDKVTWDFCGQGNNFTAYNYTAWNTPLNAAFLASERAQGRSLVTSRYHIADFRNRDLTPEYVAFLERDFATARDAGVKIHLRFAYNYPFGGPDAPLAVVLRHIDQLKPVFQNNKDVIAFVNAGFVGCWGEWHDSSNGLAYPNDGAGSATDGRITPAQFQIIDKLLEALPRDRMMTLRYPRHKFNYFGSTDLTPIANLTEGEAFGGSNRARIGFEDDCFVCNATHGGSYWNPRGDFTETPNFLKGETAYVVQGGEPGDPESTDPSQPPNPTSPLSSCAAVETLFREQHWSLVGLYNLQSPASAIKRWERDGCLETFKQKLGYRFRLVEAVVPTAAKAGAPLALTITMANDGYARPYNPRLVEMVLRNQSTKVETRLTVATAQDKRLWLPAPGQTNVLPITTTLPANLAAGQYDVFVNLPDPEPRIYTRAEFSIRLANVNTWEPGSGYNSLQTAISVEP